MKKIFALLGIVFFVMLVSLYAKQGLQAQKTNFLAEQFGDFDKYKYSGFFCRPNSGVKVVDTSTHVTPSFLNNLQKIGVKVVARYYNYSENALPPNMTKKQWRNMKPGKKWYVPLQKTKLITKEEISLLKRYKMASIAVFQFQGEEEQVFSNWKIRGPADAKRAWDLATQLGQPKGSVIFFSVDADFVNAYPERPCAREDKIGHCSDEILNYFNEIKKTFEARARKQGNIGYQIGVYGSGATCKMLKKQIVSKCWLNSSQGHSNRAYGEKHADLIQLKEYRYTIRDKSIKPRFREQLMDFKVRKKSYILGRPYCKRNVDFNQIRKQDFGQFYYN